MWLVEQAGDYATPLFHHFRDATPPHGFACSLFHWARVAVLNDPECRGRYQALRARGHSYGRALRGVADRLLGVACVLLRRRTLFDPDHGALAAP